MAGNSNQNQADSDDQASDNTSGRFQKMFSGGHFNVATLTRFGAVGLFVILGTLAVLQSMSGSSYDSEIAAEAKGASGDAGAEATPKGAEDSDDEAGKVESLIAADPGLANSTSAPDPDSNASTEASHYAQFAESASLGLLAVREMVTTPAATEPSNTPVTAASAILPNPSGGASEQAMVTGTSAAMVPKPDSGSSEKPESNGSFAASPPAAQDFGSANDSEFTAPARPTRLRATIGVDDQGDSSESGGSFSPAVASIPRVDPQLRSEPEDDISMGDSPPPNRYASNGSILGRGDTAGDGDAANTGFSPPEPPAESPAGATADQEGVLNRIRNRAGNAVQNLRSSPVAEAARDLQQRSREAMQNTGKRLKELGEEASFQAFGAPEPAAITPGSQSGPPAARAFSVPQVNPQLQASSPGVRAMESGAAANLQQRPDPATGNPVPPSGMGQPSNSSAILPGNLPPPASGQSGAFGAGETPRRSNIRQPAQEPGSANRFGDGASPSSESSGGFAAPGLDPPPSNSRIPAQPASTGGMSGGMRLPSATSRPPAEASFPAPAASPSAASRTAATTLNVPGDRELEGVQTPAISIQKLSPAEVQVNQTSEFSIVVKNVGRATVDEVQVHDRVPDGTTFEGALPEPSSQTGGQLRWDLGSLPPGGEKRIDLKLKPTRPGEMGSVAQVTFASRSSMRTKVTQPVLEISHRTNPRVLIGDDVIFDVVISNSGDGPARNILIQEDIPEQLSFQNGFREIEYAVGTLGPGQSRTLRLALKAKSAGKLKNVMFVSGDGGLKSSHELDLEIVAPQLKLQTDGPTRRFLGRDVTHNFKISNPGTAPATNVDLIARLPRGVRYAGSNNQGRYVANSHSVFWSLAQLPVGTDASVELKTTPLTVGDQPIKVEATADLNLQAAAEQPLSIEHLVDVFFDIDDVVDPIEIGSETRYRVEIVNQGTKTASNVQLEMVFPAGLKPVAVSGNLPNQIQGQVIRFEPIGSLKSGEKIELEVTGQGLNAGDHRVAVKMQSSDRPTPVAKEETTRVYSDR